MTLEHGYERILTDYTDSHQKGAVMCNASRGSICLFVKNKETEVRVSALTRCITAEGIRVTPSKICSYLFSGVIHHGGHAKDVNFKAKLESV